jgi:ribonuclease J
LLSHPHQDHYGVLDELPASWPVYCGKAAESLIRLTSGIFEKTPPQQFRNWASDVPFELGPFRITPFLTDHSAFDAYMLLIEVNGCRILYSGDFRIHGRKAALVERMMASPPPAIDALIMEGTNLGTDKSCSSEDELQQRYIDLFKATAGRVFVAWSAQNVDRTVTLFKACANRAVRRTLVVDLYTAEVLEMLAEYGRLPSPGWGHIKVVVTSAFARMYERTGRGDFLKRMLPHGISAKALAETPSKWVVMTRKSLLWDFEHQGVLPNSADAWSWSMWSGYLKEADGLALKAWFESRGCPACHIHTSGHASPSDLREFASRINPKALIPVHGVAWDDGQEGFPNILRLADGEPCDLRRHVSAGGVVS